MSVPSEAPAWDYVIVTASNEKQAEIYRTQIRLRQEQGFLRETHNLLTIADPEGKRIGSGGSTLYCLQEVLRREWNPVTKEQLDMSSAESILKHLRILILHAGGDSKRLPAYGPVGKIFVPLPGDTSDFTEATLFDRSVRSLFRLPAPPEKNGQTVVVAGDALLLFTPEKFLPVAEGVTALGGFGSVEEACRHGVFYVSQDGRLQLYAQKPSRTEQLRLAPWNYDPRPIIDLGLMSFTAATAAAWLDVFGFFPGDRTAIDAGRKKDSILRYGMDLYREICCAMGTATDFPQYLSAVRSSGSRWEESVLQDLFVRLHLIPMSVCLLPDCRFLHFGTSRQLFESGCELLHHDRESAPGPSHFLINSQVPEGIEIQASHACWIEGCRIGAPLTLQGENVLTGIDFENPIRLPQGACMDILPGFTSDGRSVWFLRCYGIEDTFKDTLRQGATFCGIPIPVWLETLDFPMQILWPNGEREEEPSLWTARIFPALSAFPKPEDWLWMFDPNSVTPEQKEIWLDADRYSAAEIALLADLYTFHRRRLDLR